MANDNELQLLHAAANAQAACDVSLLAAGEAPDPDWPAADVIARADGRVVRLFRYGAGVTDPQKAAARSAVLAAALTGASTLAARAAAKALLDRMTDQEADALRGLVLVLVDELNALRGWITSFRAAVALATNLANLQTRVAALASLPDRTGAQARAAIAAKIDAGDTDS